MILDQIILPAIVKVISVELKYFLNFFIHNMYKMERFSLEPPWGLTGIARIMLATAAPSPSSSQQTRGISAWRAAFALLPKKMSTLEQQ